ncbi:hypothetical protein JJ691_22140 [Kutzneria sp. CA-103260]|nr:hypothetical protein JJ691_22140 [Kutzneria sp. CA-103260]
MTEWFPFAGAKWTQMPGRNRVRVNQLDYRVQASLA